jgi:hypothetical protein
VVLMRAMGIPARVVTGYQGGEINPNDGYMTVRQSDAHAWAEVWLEQRGWVRVDPTAAVSPERVERNLAGAVPRPAFGGLITLNPGDSAVFHALRSLRLQMDAVTNAWNQWVLNYTPDKQKNFIQSLGFPSADWRTLMLLMTGLGALVTALVVMPLLLNRRRSDPVEAVYARFCHEMNKRGLGKAMHEGPRDYRLRLTGAEMPITPEKKIAFERFLTTYEHARYGTPGTPGADVSTLKLLLSQCR